MTANKYPGNSSLSSETKQRVIDTFSQALGLFDEARMDEVVAGCDLILQMDDQFEPASRLRAKAKDPSVAVDLSDLSAYRGMKVSSGPADDTSDDELMDEAREALARADYQTTIDSCNAVLARNPGNEEAQTLGAQAYEKLEAAPFVTQFMEEANRAIDRGDADAARMAIEKARSLDDSHPAIATAESRLGSIDDRSAQAGSTPDREPEEADVSGGFDFGESAGGFAAAFGSESDSDEPSVPAAEEEPGAGIGGSAFSTEEESAASAFEAPVAGFTSDDASSEASSFGFTLEDSPGEEAVTTPEPAPSGEGSSFDFSMGEISVSEDDQSNIKKYLEEGDALFEAGNYTGAIDAWSKIFLIDVTNDEANIRIEKAKEKKRENESKLDELLETGIAAYNRGDYGTAEETFEEVLAGDPDNFKAQEYLEKLRDHQATSGDTVVPPPPPAGDMYGDPGDVYGGPPPPGVFEEPGAEGARPARSSSAPVEIEPPSRKGRPLIAILIALIVLGAAGYLGYTMFLSDDAGGTSVEASRETEGKLTRARLAAEQGRFGQAVELLTSIPATDPLHSEAVELLAVVRQQQQQEIAAEKIELFDSLVLRGRQAMATEDYATAKSAYEEAADIQPLEPDDLRALTVARREMGELQAATNLLEQGDYAEAIANLEPILEREPDNAAARRLAGFAWYDRGVRSLREEDDHESALRYFREAQKYLPDDRMTQRNIEFIEKYRNQRPDLLHDIYIKYLAYK